MTAPKNEKKEKNHSEHDVLDALGDSYEKLYEHVANNFHRAEEKTEALFNKLIHEAKDNVMELKKISKDDADKVADWVKRDMADAAHYFAETGNELKDWFGFETTLVENQLLDMFIKAADQTTVNLLQLKEKSNLNISYYTGEVIGPATLKCDKCGEELQFRRAGKIPPCPKCHETSFHRVLKQND